MAEHLTKNDFKKCCVSNEMGGTDEMLQNGSDKDRNVSECEEY
jgi:hypothetical protein